MTRKIGKIYVSDGMRLAGGAALQVSSSDLFDLLSDESAQEIATKVYAVMVSRRLEDETQKRGKPHTAKARSNRQ